jgi:hypothetical protein
MGKLLNLILVILVILILVLGYSSLSTLKILPYLPFLSMFSPKEEKIAETPVITQEIRHIAQLATQSFYDECIYDTGVIRTGILEADQRCIIIARGEVIAGFDLQKLDTLVLNKKDKSITLLLDPPRILDVIANPSDYEIFIQDGDFTFDEISQMKELAKKKITANALRKKILERSSLQGQRIIEKFFRLLGYEKINIVVKNQLRLRNLG